MPDSIADKAKYLHGIMDMETDLKDPAIRLYGGSS